MKQKCYLCGALSESGKTCPRCKPKTELDGLVVAGFFDHGPMRELVHNFKYSNALELIEILGRLVYQALEHLPSSLVGWQVVPVPLHISRLHERGFNQAEILAHELALPVWLGIRRVRKTPTQTGLSRERRTHNVVGAFGCQTTPPLDVVLVDDVATTGATLAECARVLKLAGAKRVWGVVIARG